LVTVSTALFVSPALAKSTDAAKPPSCTAQWQAMSDTDKKATTYKDYSKSCLSGGSKAVAATPAMAPTTMKPAKPMAASTKPMAPSSTMGAAGGPAPAGATGQCKDGTFTMSKTHSGSCSHHGGVAKWF
jgi:hypothetical protein